MPYRFDYDVALLIGVGEVPGVDLGPRDSRYFIPREMRWLQDGLESGGCLDTTFFYSGPLTASPKLTSASFTETEVLAAVRAFALKLATPERYRGLIAFVGFGGYDPVAGLHLALDHYASGPTGILRFSKVGEIFAATIPQRSVTVRTGLSFTGVGYPGHNVVRTVTPDAVVPAGLSILRAQDHVVGPPSDGVRAQRAVQSIFYSPITILGPHACPNEIWTGTTDYRYYDIRSGPSESNPLLGTMAVTTSDAPTANTGMSPTSEHWNWTTVQFPATDFYLIWNPNHALTSIAPYLRFFHRPFAATSTTTMPTVTTSAGAKTYRWYQVYRQVGSGAGTAVQALLRVTLTGATVNKTEWYALSSAVNSAGYLTLANNELYRFAYISSGGTIAAGTSVWYLSSNVL